MLTWLEFRWSISVLHYMRLNPVVCRVAHYQLTLNNFIFLEKYDIL